ncbi:reverse transcriptase domain-containing protein [Lacunimicrobium album]
MDQLVSEQNLLAVWKCCKTKGLASGENRLSYHDYGRSSKMALIRSIRASFTRPPYYAPQPTREVRIARPGKSDRVLNLPVIGDRLVAKALQIALRDFWKARLTFYGKGVHWILSRLQAEIRGSNCYVLTLADVTNCFPSMPFDDIMRATRQHIAQPDLLWLIETVIRGHEGRCERSGMGQGSAYSPAAAQVLLGHVDARFGHRNRRCRTLLRYADNLSFLSETVRDGREAVREYGALLTEMNMELHSGHPINLLAQQSVELLGFNVGWRDEQLSLSIPESAFEKLKSGFIKSVLKPMPWLNALSVAKGWITAAGPSLSPERRNDTINRVVSIAGDCGFNELQPSDLRRKATTAYRKWQTLCSTMG